MKAISMGKELMSNCKKTILKNMLVDMIVATVLAAAILFFIRPTIVNGESMANTLHNGDYLIMARQAYSKHDPEKGDIVIVKSSLTDYKSGKHKLIVKRVIGVPGDKIAIRDNNLFLNDQNYIEEYTKDGVTPAVDIPGDGSSVAVPESCYYVLGDNRCNSIDSRSRDVGFINRSDIKGKVVVRLYPFSKIRSF